MKRTVGRTRFKHMPSKVGLVVTAVVVLALSACSSSGNSSSSGTTQSGANPKCSSVTTFPFGTNLTASDSAVFVAEAMGYFSRFCLNLKPVAIVGTQEQIAALATNKIWALGDGWIPALYTSQSKGLNFKVVADKTGVLGDMGSVGVVVAQKYASKNMCTALQNAKGTNFAVTSSIDLQVYLMNKYLALCKMSLKDFKLSVLPYTAMVAGIDSGQIGAAYIGEPTMTQLLQSGKAEFLTPNVGQVFGNGKVSTSFGPLFYGPYLLEPAHRQLAQEFLDAYTLGVRYYEDAFVKGQNVAKVDKIVAAGLKIPVSQYKQEHKEYFDPNDFTVPQVNKEVTSFAQSVENYFIQIGQLKSSDVVPASQLIDTSFGQAFIKKYGTWSTTDNATDP